MHGGVIHGVLELRFASSLFRGLELVSFAQVLKRQLKELTFIVVCALATPEAILCFLYTEQNISPMNLKCKTGSGM